MPLAALPGPAVLVVRIASADLRPALRAHKNPILQCIDPHAVQNFVRLPAAVTEFDSLAFDHHSQFSSQFNSGEVSVGVALETAPLQTLATMRAWSSGLGSEHAIGETTLDSARDASQR